MSRNERHAALVARIQQLLAERKQVIAVIARLEAETIRDRAFAQYR